MAEFYLVRHGQASFGTDNYDQLSELGEQQAQWLGSYFSERDIGFDQVITGTQLRHRQTAEGICRGLGHSLPFEEHAGLNEYDFYALNAALCRQHPELKALVNGDKASFYTRLKQSLQLWADDQLGGDIPETWSAFFARVSDALQYIQNSRAKRVLVVSSGGAISALTQHVLQCPSTAAIELNMQIRNTSFCHYYFNASTVRLASFNNIPHLDTPDRIEAITYG